MMLYRESLEIRAHPERIRTSAERLREISLLKGRVSDVLLRQDQVEPALAAYSTVILPPIP